MAQIYDKVILCDMTPHKFNCGDIGGKGDHRHYGTRQENYSFTSLEQLVADFMTDVATQRGDLT